MKWENRGHELENYRAIFAGRRVLIYGAAAKGKELLKVLNLFHCVEGFIDRDGKKQNEVSLPIYKVSDIERFPKEEYIIILAASERNMNLFARQLLVKGWKEGKDFFYYQNFLDYYLGIYSLYAFDMVYAPFISFQVTSICDLNCRGCAAFTSLLKEHKHNPLSELQRSIDRVFEIIDVIRVLDLCGGEPFLREDFVDIVRYVGSRYREKVSVLRTVTNGTIVPSDELCVVCRNTFQLVREKLDKFQVNYEIRKAENWIDLGIDGTVRRKETAELINFFDECNNQLRSIHNGKLFCCDYAHFGADADAYEVNKEDYLDIWSDYGKAELVEFLIGYTETGYCGMCRHCNGHVTINTHWMPVAEQIK